MLHQNLRSNGPGPSRRLVGGLYRFWVMFVHKYTALYIKVMYCLMRNPPATVDAPLHRHFGTVDVIVNG